MLHDPPARLSIALSKMNCGTCVDFPQPVSPDKTTTGEPSTARTTSSRDADAGRFALTRALRRRLRRGQRGVAAAGAVSISVGPPGADFGCRLRGRRGRARRRGDDGDARARGRDGRRRRLRRADDDFFLFFLHGVGLLLLLFLLFPRAFSRRRRVRALGQRPREQLREAVHARDPVLGGGGRGGGERRRRRAQRPSRRRAVAGSRRQRNRRRLLRRVASPRGPPHLQRDLTFPTAAVVHVHGHDHDVAGRARDDVVAEDGLDGDELVFPRIVAAVVVVVAAAAAAAAFAAAAAGRRPRAPIPPVRRADERLAKQRLQRAVATAAVRGRQRVARLRRGVPAVPKPRGVRVRRPRLRRATLWTLRFRFRSAETAAVTPRLRPRGRERGGGVHQHHAVALRVRGERPRQPRLRDV
eukprot:24880-Pelagococcus_subviridis.AAC.1